MTTLVVVATAMLQVVAAMACRTSVELGTKFRLEKLYNSAGLGVTCVRAAFSRA